MSGDASILFCKVCKKRSKCTKVCKEVERWLRRQGIYDADYIRPQVSKEKQKDGLGRWREVPFSSILPKNVDEDKSFIINNLENRT